MDLFTPDTLRSAGEAFRSGTLLLPTGPEEAAGAEMLWGDFLINRVLVAVFVVVAILYATRLLRLLPTLLGGMTRWRTIAGLEANVGTTRDRNEIGLVSGLGIVLIASRYRLWVPGVVEGLDAGYYSLALLGALAGFLLLRSAIFHILAPKSRRREDNAGIAHRALGNWATVAVLTLGATVGLLSLFGAGDLIIRNICIVEMAAFWAGYLFSAGQILADECGVFMAFLYLCVLEILPTAVLYSAEFIK